jgi:hypothetical protein
VTLAGRDKEPFEGSVPLHDAGPFDADSQQGFPHWRALGHVTWQRGPWQVSYALQYIGGLTESVELDEGFYQHRISSATYHDIVGQLARNRNRVARKTGIHCGTACGKVLAYPTPTQARNNGRRGDSITYGFAQTATGHVHFSILFGTQHFQHALQREVTITRERESPHFLPVAVPCHIERDPALVADVGRNLKPRICRHEPLGADANPEVELQPRVGTASGACGISVRM